VCLLKYVGMGNIVLYILVSHHSVLGRLDMPTLSPLEFERHQASWELQIYN
jgi:hypothetical protein